MHREIENKFMEEIPVSDHLDAAIQKSMKKLKAVKRQKTVLHVALIFCLAFVLFGVGFCCTHTSYASNLPIIGVIFKSLQNQTSYKGNIEEASTALVNQEDMIALSEKEELPDSPYIAKSNGLTVSVTEVTYDKGAIYLGICLQNDEPFPDGLSFKNHIKDYTLSYDFLNVINTVTLKDENETVLADTCLDVLEGNFTDSSTFVGISQIDLSQLNYYPSPEEIEAAGIYVENYEDESSHFSADRYWEDVKKLFPHTGERIALPDHFICELSITQFMGEDCLNTITVPVTWDEYDEDSQNAPSETEEYRQVCYDGSWDFTLDVSLDEDYLVKDINILDENGYGIVSVTKSKYSVWADTSLPAEGIDYFTAICDADGDLLAHQGHYAETYSIDGKDISRLFVFVCDYNEYMDELKSYYYSEDYEKKKQEKTFAQYLSEHAEYQTEVTFE